MSRQLPDPDLHLRESSDFILNSRLGRQALRCLEIHGVAVFLRDLLEAIHRLVHSCHLPEFTDHGLSHLCSLVARVSKWTCAPSGGTSVPLCDLLDRETSDGNEAAMLLIAILFHDVGMLSQKSEDLNPRDMSDMPFGPADIPSWVRRTHVKRLNRLLNRLFDVPPHSEAIASPLCQGAVRIASAHSVWPWQPGFNDLGRREQGLAAILAVADLLDEDANRCDTYTLIHHRHGTIENFGHWMRHSLTMNRILVREGVVHVKMVRPPGTDAQLSRVFAAIRNQLRLSLLYLRPLGFLQAGLLRVDFDPLQGPPQEEAQDLESWNQIPGLQTQDALNYCLLSSFMPLALGDRRRVTREDIEMTRDLGLEQINLDQFYRIRGTGESRSPYEQTVNSILGLN
jgi:hypothetical protein